MLIPVTHSTQCVAECAKCGFSGLVSEHDPGPPTEFSVPSPDPIWPSELHYARARITSRNLQQDCTCVKRLFDTLANHSTHRLVVHGDGCAMVAERSDGPMGNHIFLRRDYCLAHVLTRGIRTQTLFTSEKTAASAHAVKGLIMDVWL